MICLLKNEENRRNLEKLTSIIGSEDAAYYILAMNNGYMPEFTYEGKPSRLYTALLDKTDDEKTAILQKSIAISEDFINLHGNYTEGSYDMPVDENGEPSIKDVIGEEICNFEAIKETLEDTKQFIDELLALEDQNILSRDFTIFDAIDFNRGRYVEDQLSEFLQETPNAKHIDVISHKCNSAQNWDQEKMDRIMGNMQKRLANIFKLNFVKNPDGTFFYETDDNSKYSKLRVHFVNSMRKGDWRDKDGNYHKGLFRDSNGTDATLNLIYISMMDGDASTFVHELAHHYVRVFWDSDVIQKGLQHFDKLGLIKKFNKSSVSLEEKLVNAIVDRVMMNDSRSPVVKFWQSFNEMIKKVLDFTTITHSQKQNILDQITMYFQINQDLSMNKALGRLYQRYSGTLYQDDAHVDIKANAYDTILQGLVRMKDSLKAKVLKDNSALSKIEFDIESISKIDPQNKDAMQLFVLNFLNDAEQQLRKVSQDLIRFKIDKQSLFSVPAEIMQNYRTDVIEYYKSVLESTDFQKFKQLLDDDVAEYVNIITHLLSDVTSSYNIVLEDYVNNIIDRSAEQFVDVGDKAVWRHVAKLWAASSIKHGTLSKFESWIGIASQSRSPIIRLIEWFYLESSNQVRRQCLPVGHKLVRLYKQCGDKTPIRNFFLKFFELDENGLPTGYWLRSKNYGKMFKDRDAIIENLLKEYKSRSVYVDDDGNIQFPDIETEREFLDKQDILLDEISNRRYKAEYYIQRRKYLSKLTIDAQDLIQKQIDIIMQHCTDIVTGIPEIHKLTVAERDKLDELLKEKQNLSSPYVIKYAPNGEITEFVEKTGDDLTVAQELLAWRNHCIHKVKYSANSEKFDQDRQKLIKQYGEDSNAVKIFDWYFKTRRINPRFYELKNAYYGETELPDNIRELYSRKNIILNATKRKEGFYSPHLELLNDAAWAELKRIDDELSKWRAKNKSIARDEELDISSRKPVMRFVNGAFTNQPYILYLTDISDEHTLYDKYYHNVYDEDGDVIGVAPLSAFYYELPHEELYDENGKFFGVEELPSGRYTQLNKDSEYANSRYDDQDSELTQPRVDPEAKTNYKNETYYKLSQKERVFYDELLKTMQQANQWLPNWINTRSFRAPGMRDTPWRLFWRQPWHQITKFFKFITGRQNVEMNLREDYNDEVASKPNGEIVYTVPLRWIRKLDDPQNTSTDAIGSVMAYYEMAYNYYVMQRLSPIVDVFLSRLRGGINGNINNQQVERLKKFAEMNLYGRMRQTDTREKMTERQKFVSATMDSIRHKATLKMMSHNARGILKNFLDSGMSSLVEIMAKKYFEKSDVVFGIKQCCKNVVDASRSINSPNNIAKISAAMQYNGMSGSIKDIFSGMRSDRVSRFISKYYAMGEYTFTDYVIKGWLTPAIYHNHRLIDNFQVRKVTVDNTDYYMNSKEAEEYGVLDQWEISKDYRKEFMNKQQAAYNYINAGRSRKDGEAAWENQSVTLWDAYTVDSDGNFILNKKWVDIVRPFNVSTMKRSYKTEDRIAGIMKDRFAVIAGMLPQENRGPIFQNQIGQFIFMLRGWLIVFYWDCFKGGNDFGIYEKNSKLNEKSTSSQYSLIASDSDLYGEIFEFDTGQSGKGWLMAQPHAWKVLFMNFINKILNIVTSEYRTIKHLNSTNRLAVAKMSSYLFMAVLCIIGSNIFGRLLEDDPDDLLWNFGYSESLALIQERTTQVLPVAVLDLIKNATSAQTYLEDVNTVLSLPWDIYNSIIYSYHAAIQDPEWVEDQSKIVKSGSYGGLPVYYRELLKASSILFPGLGFNNIVKNFRRQGQQAYQNWLLQQSPNNLGLAYKAKVSKNNRTKSPKSKQKVKYN